MFKKSCFTRSEIDCLVYEYFKNFPDKRIFISIALNCKRYEGKL